MMLHLLLLLLLLRASPGSWGSGPRLPMAAAARAAGRQQTGQVLAGAGGAGFRAAEQRRLAQEAPADAGAGGAAAPAVVQGQPEAEQVQAAAADGGQAAPAAEQPAVPGQAEALRACEYLHMRFNDACQVGIDRSAIYFPRGSTELPTAEQLGEALAALRAGGLPAKGCCQAVSAALAARCGCIRWARTPVPDQTCLQLSTLLASANPVKKPPAVPETTGSPSR